MLLEQRAGRLIKRKGETVTVHRDRTSENTQLDRVRYCAKAKSGIVFNNIAHVLTIDLLHDAFAAMNGSKAIGIDNVNKALFEKDLNCNIIALHKRIRNGHYRPQAARIIQIPKEDGSTRPLAISSFEDKLVQWTVSKILEAIYEPVFLPCSYGFRPELNCHEALRALNRSVYTCKDGALIEIDIRKCFDHSS